MTWWEDRMVCGWGISRTESQPSSSSSSGEQQQQKKVQSNATGWVGGGWEGERRKLQRDKKRKNYTVDYWADCEWLDGTLPSSPSPTPPSPPSKEEPRMTDRHWRCDASAAVLNIAENCNFSFLPQKSSHRNFMASRLLCPEWLTIGMGRVAASAAGAASLRWDRCMCIDWSGFNDDSDD